MAASSTSNVEPSEITIPDAKRIMYAMMMYQLRKPESLKTPQIPYLEGMPGIGKSQAGSQLAEEVADAIGEPVFFANHTPADTEPTEFAGFHMPNGEKKIVERWKAGWIITDDDLNGGLSEKLEGRDRDAVKGMKFGAAVVMLDELPNCGPAQANNLPRAMEAREFDGNKLSDRVFIIGAGNRPKDRANANTLPSHLRDRLTKLCVGPDLEASREYFMAIGADMDMIGFLRSRPEHLAKFDPSRSINPSPRSWEKVNHQIEMMKMGLLSKPDFDVAMQGTVGPQASADFSAYLLVKGKLPDWKVVEANPTTFPLPKAGTEDAYVMFALIGLIYHHVDTHNIGQVAKLLDRIHDEPGRGEYAYLAFKEIENKARKNKMDLINHPGLSQWRLRFFKETTGLKK